MCLDVNVYVWRKLLRILAFDFYVELCVARLIVWLLLSKDHLRSFVVLYYVGMSSVYSQKGSALKSHS